MYKYDRRVADKRYRKKLAMRIKAERTELAQLREEKKRWEEDRKQWEGEREQLKREAELAYMVSGSGSGGDQDSGVLGELVEEVRRMKCSVEEETLSVSPPVDPQLQLFISFDDLDTQEQIKRSVRTVELKRRTNVVEIQFFI